MKMRRVFALLLAAIMVLSVISCGEKEETVNTAYSEVTYPDGGVYPVSCEDEISVWMPLDARTVSLLQNFGESEIAKGLEERTGVKVKYIHPVANMESEQFNLLLVSDDLPDVIVSGWHNYGAQKAIDEGYIMPLNDMMEKWAPNFSKVLKEMPHVDSVLKTDNGSYYAFPFIRESQELCVYAGPIVRKDWLDKAGLPIPETIDEWETMLYKFKEMGAEVPFAIANNTAAFASGAFIGAYGVTSGFYIDDNGKVAYGPLEKGYKDFLLKMKKWYDEGLLDKNFSSTDVKILDSYVLNDKTGGTFQLANSGLKSWLDTSAKNGRSDIDLVAAPYPVLNKGDRPQFSQMDQQYVANKAYAITTNCKNPELAMRFLDYGYSDEGYIFYNYGIEGVSYEQKDGKRLLTDYILHNPDGTSYADMATQYIMGVGSGPFLQCADMVRQTRFLPQQADAIQKWSDTDMQKHLMPMVTLTEEESSRMGTILTDLATYTQEMFYGFIMGTEDFNNYDEFLSRLEQLGASKAKEIYQGAVDRLNNR